MFHFLSSPSFLCFTFCLHPWQEVGLQVITNLHVWGVAFNRLLYPVCQSAAYVSFFVFTIGRRLAFRLWPTYLSIVRLFRSGSLMIGCSLPLGSHPRKVVLQDGDLHSYTGSLRLFWGYKLHMNSSVWSAVESFFLAQPFSLKTTTTTKTSKWLDVLHPVNQYGYIRAIHNNNKQTKNKREKKRKRSL